MKRTLAQRLFYDALRIFSRIFAVLFYRLRYQGTSHYPLEGGGLVCSNHQSYLDPVLVGMTCPRRMNYLARDTLFTGRFGWLIRFLDAIPIDREGSGLSGIKETLRRLKAGELVLIFPEGTRTEDGELLPIKSGFCSIARRSKQPLIPVGIDGAWQVWPRKSKYPRLGRLAVVIGEPISPESMESLSDDELVKIVRSRIAAAHAEARKLCQ
ncbi:phospholipid/glycerol acyltransferase [Pirellula staleyi DSM 6068]|uniref:Phospholipid/glycerol acyltransferase n=1 Tax=Pirellula staleyi (strain ATCC 27377 / DSM 6068 / ICPB 4128) TaxID=530564 RepID=D2QZ74_PIRSD|nr:lysophospholipid acyltransferase family protein [Pirellula staleyi]ADB18266.1 phospholipid/glycerol acyltransferase [Pirellula staleyi DSM 6068]